MEPVWLVATFGLGLIAMRWGTASQGKEFSMKKKSLHHKRLTLAAIMFASTGLAIANGPAVAQQTPAKWKPALESITVTAAPTQNWRVILTGTRLGEAIIVTASIPVPYSDLDLAQEPGAAELGRRIHVAARLVCEQLDIKYPPALYPILDGDDCVHTTAIDGMSRANQIIAAAKGWASGCTRRKVPRESEETMTFTPVVIVAVGAFLLAGCQERLTLEQAQALCTKQGGLLAVIYTQKLTMSGAGPQIASPGDCISPSKFDIKPAAPPAASASAPAPAN
jgi:UrcA family protein